MAGKQNDPEREAFMSRAGELYDEMISRAGSGDTFDDIEEQAEGVGRKLILKALRDRLAVEEKALPDTIRCPKCGARMRQPHDAKPRNLDTASGAVHYERRHAICDRCGTSFSPSGPRPEDPTSGRIEPSGSQGL